MDQDKEKLFLLALKDISALNDPSFPPDVKNVVRYLRGEISGELRERLTSNPAFGSLPHINSTFAHFYFASLKRKGLITDSHPVNSIPRSAHIESNDAVTDIEGKLEAKAAVSATTEVRSAEMRPMIGFPNDQKAEALEISQKPDSLRSISTRLGEANNYEYSPCFAGEYGDPLIANLASCLKKQSPDYSIFTGTPFYSLCFKGTIVAWVSSPKERGHDRFIFISDVRDSKIYKAFPFSRDSFLDVIAAIRSSVAPLQQSPSSNSTQNPVRDNIYLRDNADPAKTETLEINFEDFVQNGTSTHCLEEIPDEILLEIAESETFLYDEKISVFPPTRTQYFTSHNNFFCSLLKWKIVGWSTDSKGRYCDVLAMLKDSKKHWIALSLPRKTVTLYSELPVRIGKVSSQELISFDFKN